MRLYVNDTFHNSCLDNHFRHATSTYKCNKGKKVLHDTSCPFAQNTDLTSLRLEKDALCGWRKRLSKAKARLALDQLTVRDSGNRSLGPMERTAGAGFGCWRQLWRQL
jgi:hypothetical protein